MSRRIVRTRGLTLPAVGMLFLVAGCSSLPSGEGAADAAPLRPVPRQQQIAQFDVGAHARYRLCAAPNCPRATPKTAIAAIAASTPLMTPASLPADHRHPAVPPAAVARQEQLVLRFASGASALDARARRELDQALPLARHATKILILGRTDSVGPAARNHALALARAQRVRAYLRVAVPDADQLVEIDARGACCFAADNATAPGRHANRRVELVFHLRPEGMLP